jgi:hypothetical protein
MFENLSLLIPKLASDIWSSDYIPFSLLALSNEFIDYSVIDSSISSSKITVPETSIF